MVPTSDRIPFLGDTASRGSQTESPLGEEAPGKANRELYPNVVTPRPLDNMKRPWGIKALPQSRLLGELPQKSNHGNSPKKRRTIPSSNWECNPTPPNSIPTEFDLAGFAFTTLPDPHQDYDRFNNDLVIDHYRPSVRSYSGAQRKGIGEPFPHTDSHMEHIYEALQAPFPLAEPTPLPQDLETALIFNRDNSRETIREFQRSQLKALRIIAMECREETEKWYKFTPDELRGTTGTIHIALLAHLTRFTRMKGTNWLMQFVVGFPITGATGQDAVFPATNEDHPTALSPDSLYESKIARFRARAPERTPALPKNFGTRRSNKWIKSGPNRPSRLAITGISSNIPMSELISLFGLGFPKPIN